LDEKEKKEKKINTKYFFGLLSYRKICFPMLRMGMFQCPFYPVSSQRAMNSGQNRRKSGL